MARLFKFRCGIKLLMNELRTYKFSTTTAILGPGACMHLAISCNVKKKIILLHHST